jgi:5-bromo-4-chloroindolyl phosphate hydrolysis protein
MAPTEMANTPLSLTLDQVAVTWLILGIASWVLGIVLFFLILYAVILTAIRRGMRDHQLWLEGRQRVKTTTAPQRVM